MGSCFPRDKPVDARRGSSLRTGGFHDDRVNLPDRPVEPELLGALDLYDTRLVDDDLHDAESDGANLILHDLHPVRVRRLNVR